MSSLFVGMKSMTSIFLF